VDYRQANTSDICAIAALHTQSWRESYQGILSDFYLQEPVAKNRLEVWTERLSYPVQNQYVLVAESQNEVVGFICLYGVKDKILGTIVDNLHVASSYKRQGLGKQLLNHAMSWCYENYPEQGIYLEVLADNHPAVGFYQSLGGQLHSKSVWSAPCGTKVNELVYRWPNAEFLLTYLK